MKRIITVTYEWEVGDRVVLREDRRKLEGTVIQADYESYPDEEAELVIKWDDGTLSLPHYVDPSELREAPYCPYDYHEMTEEERGGINCRCMPHSCGGAYGCPEGCYTHNPGGEDVPDGILCGPATDEDEQ